MAIYGPVNGVRMWESDSLRFKDLEIMKERF